MQRIEGFLSLGDGVITTDTTYLKPYFTALINEVYKKIIGRYKKVISTFVIKENEKSTNLCRSLSSGELNKYYIYEIDLNNS